MQRAIHDALRRAESRPGEEDGLGCGAGETDRGYGALDRGAPCVEIGNGMRLVHDAEDDGALVGVLAVVLLTLQFVRYVANGNWNPHTLVAICDHRDANCEFVGPPWPIINPLNLA